jgi:prepilin-type N-terminal cleavage/methylation domain-containing protein
MMRISLRKFDRAATSLSARSAKERHGFVIVEVIVAMVLLAVAVTSLAALLNSISHSGMVATGSAYRNGVLMNEVNRLEATPYDSIPVGVSTITVTTAPYPHTRVITVAEPVANSIKTVNMIIQPTNVNYKPDTVNFTRTKARTTKVLCTTCS